MVDENERCENNTVMEVDEKQWIAAVIKVARRNVKLEEKETERRN